MKKLALNLLTATLFLAACSKEKKPMPYPFFYAFTYNGERVITPYAYLFDTPVDGRQIAFADRDITTTDLDTIVSAVGIDIDTVIDGQTYTYMKSDAVGFDRTKNFGSAFVYFKQHFVDGEFAADAEVQDSLVGGSASITLTGINYNIDYELKYKTVTVQGTYHGQWKVVK